MCTSSKRLRLIERLKVIEIENDWLKWLKHDWLKHDWLKLVIDWLNWLKYPRHVVKKKLLAIKGTMPWDFQEWWGERATWKYTVPRDNMTLENTLKSSSFPKWRNLPDLHFFYFFAVLELDIFSCCCNSFLNFSPFLFFVFFAARWKYGILSNYTK